MIRNSDNEDDDNIRRANVIALKARLSERGQQVEVDGGQLDTYEQMYNSACHLLASGRVPEAAKLLDKAIGLSKHTYF